jgi:hypothetical protein
VVLLPLPGGFAAPAPVLDGGGWDIVNNMGLLLLPLLPLFWVVVVLGYRFKNMVKNSD